MLAVQLAWAESSTADSLTVEWLLMADTLTVDSVLAWLTLVSVLAMDVAEAHASVAAFVVSSARFVACSQVADAKLTHLLADVRLQLLLLAVADATSRSERVMSNNARRFRPRK